MSAAEPVRQGAVCGALGCSEGQPLYRVDHPEKGERVVCAVHAQPLVGSVSRRRSGTGFKSSGSNYQVSTGQVTSEGGRGDDGSHDRAGQPSMRDSASERQEFGEQVDYQKLAAELLQSRLENEVAAIEDVVGSIYGSTSSGEAVSATDARRLRAEVEQLLETVRVVERMAPGATERPDPAEFVDVEALAEAFDENAKREAREGRCNG